MPRLESMPMKQLFGMTVDKENENVIYNDETHTYLSKKDGSKYVSVTTLIHAYTHPFQSDFWSAYKACEWFLAEEFKPLKKILLSTKKWKDSYLDDYGIDKKLFEQKRQEILDSYDKSAKEASARGTKIHAQMENLFYDKDANHIKKYAGGGVFDCKKGYYKLDQERAIYPEFLISYEFDEWLKICGQLDVLILDGNDITILDYKTNKKIDKESFFDQTTKKRQMMLYPLDNLPDCNFWTYSMQLSTYAYLLQQINPKFNIKKLALIHFDHDGNETEYEVDYLKDDVARMLLHYRKQNKIKSQLELDKPIVF